MTYEFSKIEKVSLIWYNTNFYDQHHQNLDNSLNLSVIKDETDNASCGPKQADQNLAPLSKANFKRIRTINEKSKEATSSDKQRDTILQTETSRTVDTRKIKTNEYSPDFIEKPISTMTKLK